MPAVQAGVVHLGGDNRRRWPTIPPSSWASACRRWGRGHPWAGGGGWRLGSAPYAKLLSQGDPVAGDLLLGPSQAELP